MQNLNYNDKKIIELLEENLSLSRETHKYAKSIRRMMMIDYVMSIVKIVIIVVPLVWGFLYLAPYLKQAADTYSELLGGGNGLNIEKIDIGNLLKN